MEQEAVIMDESGTGDQAAVGVSTSPTEAVKFAADAAEAVEAAKRDKN